MADGNEVSEYNSNTLVTFLNHASILIKKGDRYLLTDPWYQRPAFGSWLPTFAQYIHPTYLAALGSKLSILISHGHDDHCDDDLLSTFDKDIEIVTANFSAPSVLNRLRKIGFKKLKTVGREGIEISEKFTVKSYIDPLRSLDDATYTIDTGDGLVIHCNDNWFKFDEDMLRLINLDRQKYRSESIAFFSQTNSASGFPLNYRQFTNDEKIGILHDKVTKMVTQGMKNAAALQLDRFFSYAGFATVFVADKPEYLELGLTPTRQYITQQLLADEEEISGKVSVKDFYPGDILNLSSGEITKAFVSSRDYSDSNLKNMSVRHYRSYKIIDQCDSYRAQVSSCFDESRFAFFLKNLHEFVNRQIKSEKEIFASLVGKIFEIVVADLDVNGHVAFGKNFHLEKSSIAPNKRLVVNSNLFNRVLTGDILFENLYTGYGAEWERFPRDVYNRDIIYIIIMFSYVYKNKISVLYSQGDR